MTHDDEHGTRTESRSKLLLVLALTSFFMIVEIVVGLWTNSLALLADAGHMVNDVASIALALVALQIATIAANPRMTYGYRRVEVLSGALNGITLLGIGIYIIYEAIGRYQNLESIEIDGPLVLVTAVIGLLVNIAGVFILNSSKEDSVNIEGAFHHIIADVLGSIAAIIAGIGIIFFESNLPDLLASVAVSLLVLKSGVGITIKTMKILLEASPIDTSELIDTLKEIDGVVDICDYHSWRVTNGMDVLTAHITVVEGANSEGIVRDATAIAKKHGYTHVTFQTETMCCSEKDENLSCCA